MNEMVKIPFVQTSFMLEQAFLADQQRFSPMAWHLDLSAGFGMLIQKKHAF